MTEAETNPMDAEEALERVAAAVTVQAQELDEISASNPTGEPLGNAHLMGVPVQISVEVGRAPLRLSELAGLRPGSVLPLDRKAHEPADLLVNGTIVARGEVVTLDGRYGIRITSLITKT
jgi:flagellar motor switch protein FliN/FliY